MWEIIESYDPYGEHRINGLKALVVFELLCIINLVYTVKNPYFYYFYVALTAFAAELAGETLAEKYILYIFTTLGSALAIFLFGIFSSYKWLFIGFAFVYALWIYFTALKRLRNMVIPAPIILSLAAYSLIYDGSNSNFYLALNHALQTLLAMLVVLAGLILFPRKYYLWIWRRAFFQVINILMQMSHKICQNQVQAMPIIGATIIMEKYTHMLSSKMRWFSILKITMLTLELVMAMSYICEFQRQMRREYLQALARYLELLQGAIVVRKELTLSQHDKMILGETYELRTMYSLINSWNQLCHSS